MPWQDHLDSNPLPAKCHPPLPYKHTHTYSRPARSIGRQRTSLRPWQRARAGRALPWRGWRSIWRRVRVGLWVGAWVLVCIRSERHTDTQTPPPAPSYPHTLPKKQTHTGPEAFGQKHLPSSGAGLERQVMRRLIASQGRWGARYTVPSPVLCVFVFLSQRK
jgi:hypothetical protein